MKQANKSEEVRIWKHLQFSPNQVLNYVCIVKPVASSLGLADAFIVAWITLIPDLKGNLLQEENLNSEPLQLLGISGAVA